MSKNILLVSTSPRKGGNSDLLCDEFMRGAREAGHVAEKIRFSEKKINYCKGCCACVNNQGTCVQQDDMNGIYEKILAADVIVLATPVYFHSMNGQMKTFIDRICPIYSMIHDKDVYLIVSAAGSQAVVDSTLASLRTFTGCFDSVREKGVISATGVWGVGGVDGTPSMKHAYAMGQNS